MNISLCLLTWNELHGCEQDIPRLPRESFFEIFALDGGSTDGTVEYLLESGITVVPQARRSYNAAYREALQHFRGDAIIFYHPKGTVDVLSLASVIQSIEAGNDLVITSRMLTNSVNEEDGKIIRHRKWFGQLLAIGAAIRWKRRAQRRISDPLHGYRGCSREFVEALELQATGVTADLEMVRQAYISGCPYTEIPVIETGREVGGTHFPALRTGRQLLKYLVLTSR